MMKKILIANRGEIALRIIRTCKEMGIGTVAIYSSIDKESLHVQLADEAFCVGGNRSSESYLNIQNIISAAIISECDAIHPGIGFLSENAEFARKVKEAGLIFIGPDSECIENMGNKSKAREIMKNAGVPVVPGSDGVIVDIEQGMKIASEIGYPVLIKASSGGGGKGMRIANSEDEFQKCFFAAKQEAMSCFGDDSVYIEKLIMNPRHIEFQVLGDNFGNIIHLGERDCSIQRRNQKLIEEAPSSIDDDLRIKMGNAAILAARNVKYVSAGTIEFILDNKNNFYFIEMNTRLQVEHPVTEMITEIDLVKEQIRIASNLKLKFSQEDIEFRGHAIECRINAEDVSNGFRPCPGTITSLLLPGGFGVRIDTILYHGYKIPPFYDSLIAKLVVHGNTRLEAIRKMRRALEELIIDGVQNNIEFQYLIMYHPGFVRGNFNTGFIEKLMKELEK
ncbi:MAG: acetyl-CoA carboxylase biotin carboxylase subunit [Oscillospiraceae bacterium]|nr:acetyl-CoA carboxylase biotin carboxylase subunit [Oscillospiraceae bacterium]